LGPQGKQAIENKAVRRGKLKHRPIILFLISNPRSRSVVNEICMALLYYCAQDFTSLFLCSVFDMLTLYDVLEIVGNDSKRRKWMQKYGIHPGCDGCPSCEAVLKADNYRGKAGFRCSDKKCRRRVSAASGGLLEGLSTLC